MKRTEKFSKALIKSGLASILQVPGTEKATYLRCSTLPERGDRGLQEARLADRRTQFKLGNRSRLCWDTTEIPTTTRVRKQRQWPGPPNPSRSNDTAPSHNPIPPASTNRNSGLSERFRFPPCPSHCHWSLLRRQWSQAKAEKPVSRQRRNAVYCPLLLGGTFILPKETRTLLPGTVTSCLNRQTTRNTLHLQKQIWEIAGQPTDREHIYISPPKSLLMKRDATELKNRLLHFPLIKHQATTTFTANRFPNALAKNGFRLKSNQPQFTKGKGKAEPFTQSMKQLHRNTKTYKLLANMRMSYSKCVYKQTPVPWCGL